MKITSKTTILSLVGVVVAAASLAQALVTYDQELSSTALFHSAAAYCKVTSIQGWSCGRACDSLGAMQEVETFLDKETNTFGFAGFQQGANGNKEGRIVVAFRGTQGFSSMKNWMTNLDGVMVPYQDFSGIYVHQGFYDAYNKIASQLKAKFD